MKSTLITLTTVIIGVVFLYVIWKWKDLRKRLKAIGIITLLGLGILESVIIIIPDTIPTGVIDTFSVANSIDDAYQHKTAYTWKETSKNLKVDASYESGVLFQVSIGQGATINSANLSLYIRTPTIWDDPDVDIYGNDVDDAEPFGTGTTDLDSRTTTTASAYWSGTDLGSGYFNVSVGTIVSEIVDRAGWSSGNNMSFLLLDHGSSNLFMYAYDNGANYPKLYVDYTEAIPNTVTLNEPSDDTKNVLTVAFNYTPIFYNGEIANASFHVNETDWSTHHWNTTEVVNNTKNSFSYTFSSKGVYIWNFEVFNSTHSFWGEANWTVTIFHSKAVLVVNGFENETDDWIQIGSEPWLDVQDQPANWLNCTGAGEYWDAWMKNFTFEDLPDDAVSIDDVTLRGYVRTLNGAGSYCVFNEIWNGSSWENRQAFLVDNWGWDSTDVTSTLDTVEKVNNAKLAIQTNSGHCSYDYAELIVYYVSEDIQYSNIGANTTVAGKPCKFYTQWSGSKSGYIFSWFNYSDTLFHNDTWQSFTDGWSNITKTLPPPDTEVIWKIFANSTNDNWYAIPWQTLVTTTTFNVTYLGLNTTISNANADFHVFLNDTEYLLDCCQFQWDYPDGVWSAVEIVWNDKGSQTSWANITKTLPDDLNEKIWYRFIFNNSEGFSNYASNYTYTTWSNRYPTYDPDSVSENVSRSNQVCKFSVNVTSPNNITDYIFGWNDGTGWVNDSLVEVPGSPEWYVVNVTKTLPDVVRRETRWTVYVKDGNGNWERVNPQLHVVTNSSMALDYESYHDRAKYGARLPGQKKIFYWNGWYWAFTAFYHLGVWEYGAMYAVSQNGFNWNNARYENDSFLFEMHPDLCYSAYFDVYLNTTGFVFILDVGQSNDKLYYYTGQMNATSGKIDAIENHTEIYDYVNYYTQQYTNDPFVTFDNDGKVWLSCLLDAQRIVGEVTYHYSASDVFRLTLFSNGTIDSIDEGFPQTLASTSFESGENDPGVHWGIPVILGSDIYFVLGQSQASEAYVNENDPFFPLRLTYYDSSNNSFSKPVQLSEEGLWQRMFAPFSVVKINNTRFAYSFVTDTRNIRYGEWEADNVIGEVELWHEIETYTESWFTDASTPVVVVDDNTNAVFVLAMEVHRPDEVVLKRKSFDSGVWGPEQTFSNEQNTGIVKAGSIVSGWRADNYMLQAIFIVNATKCKLHHFMVNTTLFLSEPTYSNVDVNNTDPEHKICFSTYWESVNGLKEANFYWNYSGILELNDTYTFSGSPVAGWSNFTPIIPKTPMTIAWKIDCKDIYGNLNGTDLQTLILGTGLSIGWNNVTAWSIDVFHTLGEINASLAINGVNWTVITIDYNNGTQWSIVRYWNGTHWIVPIYNSDKIINSGTDTIWIACNVADEWYHTY